MTSFEEKTGVTFDNFEANLLKDCCDKIEKGLQDHKAVGSEPPYMSDEYLERRNKAIIKSQQINDSKSKKGK